MKTKLQNGFVQNLLILLVVAAVAAFVITQKTDFFQRAYPQRGLYLDKISADTDITTNMGYMLVALLKRSNGSVVVDQHGLEYQWSNEYPDAVPLEMTPLSVCTYKINPPCPNDHLKITASQIGSQSATNIKVRVVDKLTKEVVAETTFYVDVLTPERYTTFDVTNPVGGESFKVGQGIDIAWSKPDKNVDYYNLYYSYYKAGQQKGGYIASPKQEVTSYNWIIPAELKGQNVKVIVEANRGGYFIRRGSANYFAVH